MQLSKYVHSCVRVDDGDRSIVFDPGMFSEVDAALDGVGAVLITHEHADHVNVEAVRASLAADSRRQLFAPAVTAGQFAEFGEQVTVVAPGESVTAAGFEIRTFGGQHAVIHPRIPVIANVGYLVEGCVYHPGDSLIVPPVPVQTLLMPAMAPWANLAQLIDYAVAVRAPQVLPIHDYLVVDAYFQILERTLVPIAAEYGVRYGEFTGVVEATPART